MITQLRFKNWRSLKDVTIDLGKINVFIGANSSGKTNILDGLHFLHRMVEEDSPKSTYFQVERSNVRTIGVGKDEAIEIEAEFKIADSDMKYGLHINTKGQTTQFDEIIEGANGWSEVGTDGVSEKPGIKMGRLDRQGLLLPALAVLDSGTDMVPPSHYLDLYRYIALRWQFLDDNFIVSTRLPNDDEKIDLYSVDRKARNIPLILEFMRQEHPNLYQRFQDDVSWLLNHVHTIATERDEVETRYLIHEKTQTNHEAPTISTGTSRIVSMLTAFYVLDMRLESLPGLVVIEEPDTALNPGLLRRFVEQIRVYAEGENPRQFIFTTHNPAFLDYFKPEEVRVVERDENGYTTVNKIPDYIEEIWLKNGEYGLGEVWTTRSFGGVPE